MTDQPNNLTFKETKQVVTNVWKITTVVLSICMGGIIGATTMFYQVEQNAQEIQAIERALNERHEFMGCAMREIDRLDVQSVDPEHRSIEPRCRLELPSSRI